MQNRNMTAALVCTYNEGGNPTRAACSAFSESGLALDEFVYFSGSLLK
jgi:hypothetical protein